MTQLITAGGMRIDYLITQDGEARTGLVGGNALYSAVGAAIWKRRMNGRVGLWARIGQNYPNEWLKALEALGLNTAGLVPIPGKQDHRTFYAYTPDGRRVDTEPAAHFGRINQPLPDALTNYIHSTPGQDNPNEYEPLALRPEDWPEQHGGMKPDIAALHIAPISIRTHMTLPPFLKERGIQIITIDPGERYMRPDLIPYLRRFLPYVDAFLPSAQEVRSLFGQEVDLWKAAETLAEWGTAIVVIKHGANGVLIYERENGRKTHLPAYHSAGDNRIVDITGAGDAFCGGFLAGLFTTRDIVRSAEMGLVSASLVIEGYGALYALNQSSKAPENRLKQLHDKINSGTMTA
ncbi:MAG: carbohydrate kinase family protein [Candidatus Promineifilaceae bacterium]